MHLKRKLLNEKKAQLSIELIIVTAAVIAIVLVIVSQLQNTATKGAKKIADKTGDVFDKIDAIK